MTDLWQRYQKHLCRAGKLGITLDISRMDFEPRFFSGMEEAMNQAYQAMDALEGGAIANPDEERMVGHYWLRAPQLAPTAFIREEIEQTVAFVRDFAKAVHSRKLKPRASGAGANRFTDVLQIGIGGSALGPQLVADALSAKRDKLRLSFLDNTDPDGIQRTLDALGTRLKSTLVLVVSKSGTTAETHNSMVETQAAFKARGIDFASQAVAITGRDSKLDRQAQEERWLGRFPMWDWVGGRTSVTSAVGLVPAALQGVDIDSFLAGAAAMDEITRRHDTRRNPAALLALMWHHATGGQGAKDMVILPYKDRLLLLSRYLQQLVMESLGKKDDLAGNVVHQGISVFGNKGSTDQHAYVQQLRDGLNNFFATFIVVLKDTPKPPKPRQAGHVEVSPDPGQHATSGDFLNGFWQGTRQALYEGGRSSMTITVDQLDASTLGALIALYERAVGFYATLVNINAYHQPGVEAGKKAAASVLEIQKRIVECFAAHRDTALSAEDVAQQIGQSEQVETVYHVLEHLAANKRFVKRSRGKYTGRDV